MNLVSAASSYQEHHIKDISDKAYGDVDKRIHGDESKKAFAAPENAKRLAIVWKCMAAVVCDSGQQMVWVAD